MSRRVRLATSRMDPIRRVGAGPQPAGSHIPPRRGPRPRYTRDCRGLIVGADTVAVDAEGLRILEAKRRDNFGKDQPFDTPPCHIRIAEERFRLGGADPACIDVVRSGWIDELPIQWSGRVRQFEGRYGLDRPGRSAYLTAYQNRASSRSRGSSSSHVRARLNEPSGPALRRGAAHVPGSARCRCLRVRYSNLLSTEDD